MLKANLNNDSFTETTTTGYFARIKNAIVGVLIGIALFLGAFVVLFWNEGRVNLSEIAKTSTTIEANTQASPDLNNKLVSLTGDLTTEELIGDNVFIKPDNYLLLDRNVEMYAWKEDVDTETKKNTGGSETTTKTYSYYTKWMSNPENSSNFSRPEGHYNPQKSLEDYSIQANKGKMGIYTINVRELNLPASKELELKPELLLSNQSIQPKTTETTTQQKTETAPIEAKPVSDNTQPPAAVTQPITTETQPTADNAQPASNTTQATTKPVSTDVNSSSNPVLSGNFLFKGKGSLASPEIGDLRISYNSIKSGENGTIFGKLTDTSIEKYTNKEGNSILCMRNGDREAAIAMLKSEHETVTWIFRVVGFFMMLIGLNLIFAPIAIVLDFLPFIGNISRTITGIILFIASVILSIVTIIISIIINNIVYLIIASLILILITALIVVGGVFIFQKIKKPA